MFKKAITALASTSLLFGGAVTTTSGASALDASSNYTITLAMDASNVSCVVDTSCLIDYSWTDAWVRGDNPQLAVWYTNKVTGEKFYFQTVKDGKMNQHGKSSVKFPSDGVWSASSKAWDILEGNAVEILVGPKGVQAPFASLEAGDCLSDELCEVVLAAGEPLPFAGGEVSIDWVSSSTGEKVSVPFNVSRSPKFGVKSAKGAAMFDTPGTWTAQPSSGFREFYGSGVEIKIKRSSTAPTAPTGLALEALKDRTGFAAIWDSNPASENVTSYLVRASTNILGGKESSCIVNVQEVEKDYSCFVPSLGTSVPTFFRVVAKNATGWGDASSLVGPEVIAGAPSVPGTVKAEAGPGEVTLTWTAPKSNGGVEIEGYEIFDSKGILVATVDGETFTYVVSPVAVDTPVAYGVRAINKQDVVGDLATTNTVVAYGPADVAGASVEAVAGTASAVVTWAGFKSPTSPIQSYKVVSVPAGGECETTVSNTSCVINGLKPSTDYHFNVTAFNGVYSSPVESNMTRTVPDSKWLEEPTLTEPRFNPETNGVEFEVTSNPITIGVDVEYEAHTSDGTQGTVVCDNIASSVCTVSFPNLPVPTDGSITKFTVTPIVDGVTGTSAVTEGKRIANMTPLTALNLIDTGWVCSGGQTLVGTSCRSYTGYVPVGSHEVSGETGRQTTPPCPAGWNPSWAMWPNGGTGGDVCVEMGTTTVTDYGCPGGWNDGGGTCYQDVPASRTQGFKASFTPGWGEKALSDYGVAKMVVNGVTVINGESASLGLCPGDVIVDYYGYNGKTSVTKFACETGKLNSKIKTLFPTAPYIASMGWDGISSLSYTFKMLNVLPTPPNYWVFTKGKTIIGLTDLQGVTHVGDLKALTSGNMDGVTGEGFDASGKKVVNAKSLWFNTPREVPSMFRGRRAAVPTQTPSTWTAIPKSGATLLEWGNPANMNLIGPSSAVSFRIQSKDGGLDVRVPRSTRNLILPPNVDPETVTVKTIGYAGEGPATLTVKKQIEE
jgi:hypothetical protein